MAGAQSLAASLSPPGASSTGIEQFCREHPYTTTDPELAGQTLLELWDMKKASSRANDSFHRSRACVPVRGAPALHSRALSSHPIPLTFSAPSSARHPTKGGYRRLKEWEGVGDFLGRWGRQHEVGCGERRHMDVREAKCKSGPKRICVYQGRVCRHCAQRS